MKYLHVVGYSSVLALLFATYFVYAGDNARLRLQTQVAGHRLRWIEDSALRLSEGERRLSIYSMKDVDQLLLCFAHRPDIANVALEMTDVGPAGIRAIASMPNVRSISFSGDHGMNDETLLILGQCAQLESLSLTCTKVTDEAIAQFQSRFPKCSIKQIRQ